MAEPFDAVVVGAGPAGSAAALVLARAGCSVCLFERGPFPGSKNMYGGVVYGRILDGLVPAWWNEMPVQRWITRRSTMVMTPTQALTVDFRTDAWGKPPYNGATTLRPELDRWLTGKAVEAGATLVCSTVATGLLRDERGRIAGVRTDRPDSDLPARAVVACDGVNSFLAKEAGLHRRAEPEHFALGVKEVLSLPAEEIDRRFNLSPGEGMDIEILGATQGIPGGGFLYTNVDTIAVGLVLGLPALAERGVRPEELIADLKRHPAIAPLVRGSTLVEYSAHVVPEGGIDAMPDLATDGMVVAGDAACMALAAGVWLEGVNFAIGSGAAAGEAVAAAIAAGDTSRGALMGYRRRLESSFVLQNHRRLRPIARLSTSERMQTRYPALACDLVEAVFTVADPAPKRGMLRLTREHLKRDRLKTREVVADLLTAFRSLR
ncbi:MAG: FAD-dependent oxidoreductase [Actinobacteria bacterium]|nr:FAD-dependent oxidoreductase [Actinomycetota bacterium]